MLTLAVCSDVRCSPDLLCTKAYRLPVGQFWGISTFGRVVAALASASWTSVKDLPDLFHLFHWNLLLEIVPFTSIHYLFFYIYYIIQKLVHMHLCTVSTLPVAITRNLQLYTDTPVLLCNQTDCISTSQD